jgi:hypothetical protein
VARGVRVLTAGGDDLTVTDDPFKVAMRQIAGTFAQLEKARLVAKLRGARERRYIGPTSPNDRVWTHFRHHAHGSSPSPCPNPPPLRAYCPELPKGAEPI